ncbi:STAS domain-containing protein [Cryobacterium breve]|jgi:anti-sigma B factor antagonist|uniref:Anti-sigma factor antagonist n=1 Tax=Cryobacterium breve TaxID=1259258 RepID=A0ABY7N8Q7_9MICO|nr:STAS domain-containing protein [Cryobacterium breve]WBM78888.1 STAS domain-containing protein [Cryobacterium breve]
MNNPDTFRASPRSDLTVGVATPASGLAVVTLVGRLDAVAAPDLRARLDQSDVAGCPQVVFDLAAVDFVDSAGLAVLVWQRRTCRSRAGDVVLVRPDSDHAMRVFRLTQFDQIFRMLPQQQDI